MGHIPPDTKICTTPQRDAEKCETRMFDRFYSKRCSLFFQVSKVFFRQDMILKQDGSRKDQLGGKFSIFNVGCGSNYNPEILPSGKLT